VAPTKGSGKACAEESVSSKPGFSGVEDGKTKTGPGILVELFWLTSQSHREAAGQHEWAPVCPVTAQPGTSRRADAAYAVRQKSIKVIRTNVFKCLRSILNNI